MIIKRNMIASVLLAVLYAFSMASTNAETDVIIQKWTEYGTLHAHENSVIYLNGSVPREEAARMLSTIIEFCDEDHGEGIIAFSDVSENSSHYEHVKIVALTGVMGGVSSDLFGVGQPMTREQTAVVLYRLFAATLDSGSLGSFSDLWQSSGWAGGPISVLAGNGIVNGYDDGSFLPHQEITRLEFITILDRLMPEPARIAVNLPEPGSIPDFDRTDPNPPPVDPYAHLRGKKLIALTYDDGPFGTHTPRVLDELEAKGVKATFFMTGNRALAWPDTVKRVVDEGHQLASHTFSHALLTGLPTESILWEVNHNNDVLEEISGVRPTVLRPPFGSISTRVKETVGMPIIMWSIDPQDWDGKSSDYIVSHVTSRASDGDIIILHDTLSATVRATGRIIDRLHDEGFVFVTIDEMIAVRGGAVAGEVYNSFRG